METVIIREKGSIEEYDIIELQGKLSIIPSISISSKTIDETKEFKSKVIGRIQYTSNNTVSLRMQSCVLEGKIVELKKKIAVMEKDDDRPGVIVVKGVICRKFIFNKLPTPQVDSLNSQ